MNCPTLKCIPYLLIAIGLGLAFASAVVPHFTSGYRLAGGVLLAGLLPYLTYGLAAPLLHGPHATAAGLALVGLHAVLVFVERIHGAADYSDGMIYIGPLVLALATLPLLLLGLARPWGATPPVQPAAAE